jgi:hypothetical protein
MLPSDNNIQDTRPEIWPSGLVPYPILEGIINAIEESRKRSISFRSCLKNMSLVSKHFRDIVLPKILHKIELSLDHPQSITKLHEELSPKAKSYIRYVAMFNLCRAFTDHQFIRCIQFDEIYLEDLESTTMIEIEPVVRALTAACPNLREIIDYSGSPCIVNCIIPQQVTILTQSLEEANSWTSLPDHLTDITIDFGSSLMDGGTSAILLKDRYSQAYRLLAGERGALRKCKFCLSNDPLDSRFTPFDLFRDTIGPIQLDSLHVELQYDRSDNSDYDAIGPVIWNIVGCILLQKVPFDSLHIELYVDPDVALASSEDFSHKLSQQLCIPKLWLSGLAEMQGPRTARLIEAQPDKALGCALDQLKLRHPSMQSVNFTVYDEYPPRRNSETSVEVNWIRAASRKWSDDSPGKHCEELNWKYIQELFDLSIDRDYDSHEEQEERENYRDFEGIYDSD